MFLIIFAIMAAFGFLVAVISVNVAHNMGLIGYTSSDEAGIKAEHPGAHKIANYAINSGIALLVIGVLGFGLILLINTVNG